MNMKVKPRTLFDVYEVITSQDHYWRFERSTMFVQRMASCLLNIELDDKQAQQVLDIMADGQARIEELRNNENLDYPDISAGITAIQTLYIDIPLKLIEV